MNAKSLGTIVKKSVGWSIGLSVLMILAGFLAIAVPQAAGIAVNLLVAWLLVFSGAAHLVFAWHTRTTGGILWELLVGILYVFRRMLPAVSSTGWLGVTHSRTRDLPVCRRSLGTYVVVAAPPHAGLGLAAIRRNHHPDPCRHDLEDLAIEHRMGHRHACGDQHALQRNLSPDAFSSRAPTGRQVGLEKALAR